MRIIVPLSYSDLFAGEIPTLEEILIGIPSETVISILSLINSQLYLGDKITVQIKIFDLLLKRQSNDMKVYLFTKLKKKIEKEPTTEFFSSLYIMEFMHYEFANYRYIKIEETNPEQELRIFKAYFIIIEQVHLKYSDSLALNRNLSAEFFDKMTWPTLIDQFEINQNINPMTGMIKALTLLNYLQFHSPYEIYVTSFLGKYKKNTSWDYIIGLFNLIKKGWEIGNEDPNKLYPFALTETEEYTALLNNFTISIEKYKELYSDSKRNFSGFKDKPLFKYKSGTYLVINWNFLSNKLYEGFIFDFYSQSGISDIEKFKSFTSFKSFVASEITEKIIFRKLIKKCFPKHKDNIAFDEKNIDSFPDAYIRQGKHIFLFEIKDAFFSAKPINSLSYQDIKGEIDRKYNKSNKGTGQIIKQLEKLKNSPFENQSFEEIKIKIRNLEIYPIIIYTDSIFNLPGVNQYLIRELNGEINEKKLHLNFQKIHELTFINLSFLIDNIHLFSNPNFHFKKLINDFHSQLKSAKKKHQRIIEMGNFFAMYNSFEQVITTKYLLEINKNRSHYIKTIMEALELTEGLR